MTAVMQSKLGSLLRLLHALLHVLNWVGEQEHIMIMSVDQPRKDNYARFTFCVHLSFIVNLP